MKLVRFLVGSLLVAGMPAVAPAAFADENGGERGPREVSNKDQGARGRGAQCWNPTCACGGYDDETETSWCDYGPWNGKCFCNFMTTPKGGDCEAT
ncbi:MAG: hypothetical protein ACYDBY_06875 [Thermoanaerobaculia bacterium]